MLNNKKICHHRLCRQQVLIIKLQLSLYFRDYQQVMLKKCFIIHGVLL